MRRLMWLLVCVLATGCGDDSTASKDNNGNIRNVPENSRNSASNNANAANNTGDMGFDPDATIVVNCTPGELGGCVDESAIRVCNPGGTAFEPQACPGGEQCLVDACTSNICVPNTIACEGGESVKTCNAEGTGYGEPEMCPPNTVCDQGSCKTVCELGKYRSSYIGCEYWTVDLDQYTDPSTNPKPDEVPHAIVVSNPNDSAVTLAFYSSAASVNVADPTIPANSVRSFQMPRLDVSGTSLTNNAINVVSSLPVSMHQFNPLNNANVFSNDASLLLPVNVVGKEYFAVNWPTQVLPAFMGFNPEDQHSYVTIIAVDPGTTNLNITSTAQIMAGPGVGATSPGVSRGYSLTRGQVLNLQALDASNPFGGNNDLTGTRIISDQNIAVFVGHEEAVIAPPGADGTCCADHLEQQLFPVSSWGTRYIAPFSPGRGTKVDHWRIVSAEDGVTLTTNPPQQDANNVVLNAGDFVSFFSDQSFEVNATGKVLVSQFLVSQRATSAGTGDPAMVLAVPNDRFRPDYVLLTPEGYSSNYVSIIRPAGMPVMLNGTAVNATFTAVGSGAFEVASVEVQPGIQNLESSQPFGIIAYGFDNAVSYAYPGGLNLVGQEVE